MGKPCDKHTQDVYEKVISVRENQKRPIPQYIPGVQLRTVHEICQENLFPEILKPADQQDPFVVKLTAVLCYLAPTYAGKIPHEPIADCLQIADSVPGIRKSDRLLIDVALAFAAGWRRSISIGQAVWDKPWDAAREQLVEIALAVIDPILFAFKKGKDQANALMEGTTLEKEEAGNLLGVPRNFHYPGLTQVREWAIASIEGDKRLRHSGFLQPPEVDTGKSAIYRYLEKWDPAHIDTSLMDWLRYGIHGQRNLLRTNRAKGRPIGALKVGEFRHGHLYLLMSADEGSGYVLIRKAAFVMCHQCTSGRTEFGEDYCQCGRRLESSNYYVILKEILLIPGVYIKEKRFRRFTPSIWPEAILEYLRHKKNKRIDVYYEDSLGECPHDYTWKSSKLSNPFVRSSILPSGKDDEAEPEPPDEIVSRRELQNLLKEATQKLPYVQLEIVREHVKKRTMHEIAGSLGLSEDNVEALFNKALTFLRSRLGPMIRGA